MVQQPIIQASWSTIKSKGNEHRLRQRAGMSLE